MLQPLVFHGAYGYDSFLPRSWSVVLTALYPGGKASDPLVEHEALLRIDGDRVDDEDDDDSTGATIEAKCFDLPSFRGCEGHWSLCYAHADLRSPRQWHDCLAVPAISSNAAAATVRMHLDLNRPFPDPESAVLVRATFTFTSNGKHCCRCTVVGADMLLPQVWLQPPPHPHLPPFDRFHANPSQATMWPSSSRMMVQRAGSCGQSAAC